MERELCESQVNYLCDRNAQIKYHLRQTGVGVLWTTGYGFSNTAREKASKGNATIYISPEDYDAQPYEFKALYVEALLINRRKYIEAIDETIAFHRLELMCAKAFENGSREPDIEEFILNKENEKKLRKIVEYIDMQLHFDVFLDIHSIHEKGQELLSENISYDLMNRYKNALCVGQKNLDWLDKYLSFSTIHSPFRNKDKVNIQNDNIWKMCNFYREM